MSKSALKIDGLPVEDAKKPITLSIGQIDIPLSKSKDPAACVAARACIRDLGAEAARIHLSRIFIKLPKQKKWLRFQTPQSLRNEIIAFDRGGRFITGDYILMPMTPSQKREYHKEKRRRHDLGRKTGKKRKLHFVTGVRANGHGELGG